MKKVLITGGAGFLGRELARTLKSSYNVVIAGRNNLANQQAELWTGCDARPLDVANVESVKDVFNEVKPDIVVHAAATKYVGWSEKNPLECVDVNIVGSQNIARVAIDHNVELVVGVSTDKATPPCNSTYGLSKAMMERMYCGLNRKNGTTKFVCTRFGNIAWSSGSVFCLWKQMQESTHDKMISSTGSHQRRFFITVEEAADVIVKAIDWSEALQGKIFIKHMKAAQMSDVLKMWTKKFGGSWKKIDPRLGDSDDEHLIGKSEVEFTSSLCIDNKFYYVLSTSEKPRVCISHAQSSKNGLRLDEEEIVALLGSRPIEI